VAVEDFALAKFKNAFDKLADTILKALGDAKASQHGAADALKKLLEAKTSAVAAFIEGEKEKEATGSGPAPHPHTMLHAESGSMHAHAGESAAPPAAAAKK